MMLKIYLLSLHLHFQIHFYFKWNCGSQRADREVPVSRLTSFRMNYRRLALLWEVLSGWTLHPCWLVEAVSGEEVECKDNYLETYYFARLGKAACIFRARSKP